MAELRMNWMNSKAIDPDRSQLGVLNFPKSLSHFVHLPLQNHVLKNYQGKSQHNIVLLQQETLAENILPLRDQ